MDDQEQDRRQKEEGEQRQVDTEERQLDRLFEEEVGVRHRARSDGEIEEHKKIGEPQAAADRGGVVERLLDRFEVVGLFGDAGKFLLRGRVRSGRGCGRRRSRLRGDVGGRCRRLRGLLGPQALPQR